MIGRKSGDQDRLFYDVSLDALLDRQGGVQCFDIEVLTDPGRGVKRQMRASWGIKLHIAATTC